MLVEHIAMYVTDLEAALKRFFYDFNKKYMKSPFC